MKKSKSENEIKKILNIVDKTDANFSSYDIQKKIIYAIFDFKGMENFSTERDENFYSELKKRSFSDRVEFFSFCFEANALESDDYFGYIVITKSWNESAKQQLNQNFSPEEKEKIFEYWKERANASKNIFLKLHYLNLLLFFGHDGEITNTINLIIDNVLKKDNFFFTRDPTFKIETILQSAAYEKISLLKRVLQLLKKNKNWSQYEKIKEFLIKNASEFSKIKPKFVSIKLHLKKCKNGNCSRTKFCGTSVTFKFYQLALFYWIYIDEKTKIENNNNFKVKEFEKIINENSFKSTELSEKDSYLFEKNVFLIFESLLNKGIKENLIELLNEKFKLLIKAVETIIKREKLSINWAKNEIIFLLKVYELFKEKNRKISLNEISTLINQFNNKYPNEKIDLDELIRTVENNFKPFPWNEEKKILNEVYEKYILPTKIKIKIHLEGKKNEGEKHEWVRQYITLYSNIRKFNMKIGSNIELDYEDNSAKTLIYLLNKIFVDFKENIEVKKSEDLILFFKKQKVFIKIKENFWMIEKAVDMFLKKEYYISNKLFVDFYDLLISKIAKKNKIDIWKPDQVFREKNISSYISKLRKKIFDENLNNQNDKNQGFFKIILADCLFFMFDGSHLNLRNRYCHLWNIKELKEASPANWFFFVTFLLFAIDSENFFW